MERPEHLLRLVRRERRWSSLDNGCYGSQRATDESIRRKMKLTIKAGALLNAIDQAGMTIGKKADLPFSWMYLEARGDKENQ